MARTETDLLGSREVPDDAWYGIHTLRAVENFPISGILVSSVPELIRGMVLVKKAATLANVQLGALPPKVGQAILAACDEVLEQGRCLDQFPIDVFQGGAGTSMNMNTNEVLANLALEQLGLEKGRYDVVDPNDHVNRSQSTNDAYPTGFRLALDALFARLATAVQSLADAFEAKGTEFAHIVKLGRTQLQDAVPMTLGQEFTAFGVTLAEEIRHIEYARTLLLEVNLGATAIGTGLNTPPGYRELAVAHRRCRGPRPDRGDQRHRRLRPGPRHLQAPGVQAVEGLQRSATVVLGAACRAERDQPAGASGWQLDHAGEGQSRRPGGREPNHVQGPWQ